MIDVGGEGGGNGKAEMAKPGVKTNERGFFCVISVHTGGWSNNGGRENGWMNEEWGWGGNGWVDCWRLAV